MLRVLNGSNLMQHEIEKHLVVQELRLGLGHIGLVPLCWKHFKSELSGGNWKLRTFFILL